MNRLFAELQRRNVIRAGATYLVFTWLIVQLADIVGTRVSTPAWAMQGLVVVLIVGFIVTVIVAWRYELTDHGLKPETEVTEHIQPLFAGRQFDLIIICVLAVAFALTAAQRLGWIS